MHFSERWSTFVLALITLFGTLSQATAADTPASDAKPWPPAIAIVSIDCRDSTMMQYRDEIVEARRVGNDSKIAAIGKYLGDSAGVCYQSYRHPYFLLLQAASYIAASQAQDALGAGPSLTLLRVAADDVGLLSAYQLRPADEAAFALMKPALAAIPGPSQSADPAKDAAASAVATVPPSTRPALTALSNDKIFSDCRSDVIAKTSNRDDADQSGMLAEFRCVYAKHDFRAAEVIGKSLSASDADQQTLYMLADDSRERGDDTAALSYAKTAYSRVRARDKASCTSNQRSCADLRDLLMKLEPTYRKKFAVEDSQIKMQARETAQQNAQAARESARDAAEQAREAASVVIDLKGKGQHSSESFSVNSEWTLEWSYDCSDFGNKGNFIVNVDPIGGGLTGMGVNQLGNDDSGSESFHQGGTFYLDINSECAWTVRVING